MDPILLQDNDASRRELRQCIDRLADSDFDRRLPCGWTVSMLLCHLAFWDQRVLYMLREYQRSGFEAVRLSKQSIDSINAALGTIARAVPGRLAAQLALESAAAADAEVRQLGSELMQQISAAGFERLLKRSLHRGEHLRALEEALRGGDVLSSPLS